ncbi:Uncharacterised protein [Serratia fonticola]|nr:Uncharacterised protein [Serratia fonticola]
MCHGLTPTSDLNTENAKQRRMLCHRLTSAPDHSSGQLPLPLGEGWGEGSITELNVAQ